MENIDMLRQVKADVMRGDFHAAIKTLEKLLILLKMDFEAGIDREANGRAFNSLVKVRRELIIGRLSEESYRILKLNPGDVRYPGPKPERKHSDDDWGIASPNRPIPTPNPQKEPKPEPIPTPDPKIPPENQPLEGKGAPEDKILENDGRQFQWDDIPTVTFEDIAGLDEVKMLVERKVLLPLLHPEMMEGYVNNGGGGVCLYGPPGTGKTMISAAIANRIGAKFCSITPSDLLQNGQGNTERAVKALFAEARSFPCSLIYFDEMDSIAPKNTKSTAARQLRSEFLAQLQGVSSYGKGKKNILFLICATNKPWDIDSAFLRPGRFGTLVYVGLPDEEARRYIVTHRLDKIRSNGKVDVKEDIDLDKIVSLTEGFNCADVNNLMNIVEEASVFRAFKTSVKEINNNDFLTALKKVHSTVQADDIAKLSAWRAENDIPISFEDEDIEPSQEPEQEPAPTQEEAEPAPVLEESQPVEETNEEPKEDKGGEA